MIEVELLDKNMVTTISFEKTTIMVAFIVDATWMILFDNRWNMKIDENGGISVKVEVVVFDPNSNCYQLMLVSYYGLSFYSS